MTNLLRSEGFDVYSTNTLPTDPALLDPYDAFIMEDPFVWEIPNAVLSRVQNGAGLFIMSMVPAALAVAGVVPDQTVNRQLDVTSRLRNHTILNGVGSLEFDALPIKKASSEAYELVLGNDATFGVRDPILVVANTYGKGKVIATASFIGEDYMITRKDNALFVKNLVYWIVGETVPEPPSNPSISEIIDTLIQLKTNVSDLSQRLEQLWATLSSIPNFASLNTTIDSMQDQIESLNSTCINLQELFDNLSSNSLSSRIDTLQNIMLVFIATTVILIGTTIFFARRKPKTKPQT